MRERKRAGTPAVALIVLSMLASLCGVAAAGIGAPASAATVNRDGNVTATLFQWPWTAVAEQCTTNLGPAGYSYVQVSPPTENIQGTQWWTSYQTVSYTLDNKLGNRAEFAAMVQTCHDAGVKVIADAVINHMTGNDVSQTVGTAGTSYSWRNYPGTYSSNDFHSCLTSISNYQDRYDVQNCNLVSLADLDTGSEYVRQTIANYLNDLTSLGVDGFRIDAAKHIAATDLAAIKAKMTDHSAYLEFEVIGSGNEPITESEYTGMGRVNEFDYARELKNYMQGALKDLQYFATQSEFIPSSSAHVFVDNWDTERNNETLNYKRGDTYNLANYFMLAYTYGDVNVYSGYRWSDKDAGAPQTNGEVNIPVCQSASTGYADGTYTCAHAWTPIEGMVAFRNATAGTSLTNWWDNGNDAIAFSRGSSGFIAINGESYAVTQTFTTGLADGTYCDRITGGAATGTCSGTTVTVSGGKATITVPSMSAVAIDRLSLSGATATASATASASASASASATTAPAADGLRVYFSTSWTTPYAHYAIGSGAWTAVPGVAMTASQCTGLYYTDIANSGQDVTGVFNDGNGTWDHATGGGDYTWSGANPYILVADGAATATATIPCAADAPQPTPTPEPSASASPTTEPTAPASQGLTVYYATSWTTPYAHYAVGSGAWTAVPGARMTASQCSGLYYTTIDNGAKDVAAVFNNGSGTWDNAPGGGNYALSGGQPYALVRNGVVTSTATSPCAADQAQAPRMTVYYASGWSAPYAHYAVSGGSWTAVPGTRMTASQCSGLYYTTIDNGEKDVAAVFNNGSGTWDNAPGGGNYALPGDSQYNLVRNGQVTSSAVSPCAADGL